jgi:hypothetical protein
VIFWHIGGAILIFRYVYRDPRIDLRFLALGAILPDLIDKPLGTILMVETFDSGRIFGHTLAFSFLWIAVVLAVTRRGEGRRRWLAVGIGSLLHLLLDGMWVEEEVFLWPAFGWTFPAGPADYWSGLLGRMGPWEIAQELAGLAYLLFLVRKEGLTDRGRWRRFLQTGTPAP